ncbi:MAG: hypothetical protein ACI8RZ_001538 [Myxococcota bacterium]|jgi:hypothetical protein
MLPGWLSLLGGLEPAPLSVSAGASWMPGQTPPFWSDERDRLQGEASLLWAPGERARIGLAVDGYRLDRYPDGSTQRGPGDITMSTDLWLWRGPVDLGVASSVKQPNADDERQLGTDEADISLMGRLGAGESARLEAAGGVTFAGDPHRFTSSDAIPEFALSGALATGWGAAQLLVGGGLPTDHNPARLSASLSVATACPARLSATALVGLSEAAPDWGVRLMMGYCGG